MVGRFGFLLSRLGWEHELDGSWREGYEVAAFVASGGATWQVSLGGLGGDRARVCGTIGGFGVWVAGEEEGFVFWVGGERVSPALVPVPVLLVGRCSPTADVVAPGPSTGPVSPSAVSEKTVSETTQAKSLRKQPPRCPAVHLLYRSLVRASSSEFQRKKMAPSPDPLKM